MDHHRTNPAFSVPFNAYYMHEGASEHRQSYEFTHHDVHALEQHYATHSAPAATSPAGSSTLGFGDLNHLNPYAWQNAFDTNAFSPFLSTSTSFSTAQPTSAVPLAYDDPPFGNLNHLDTYAGQNPFDTNAFSPSLTASTSFATAQPTNAVPLAYDDHPFNSYTDPFDTNAFTPIPLSSTSFSTAQLTSAMPLAYNDNPFSSNTMPGPLSTNPWNTAPSPYEFTTPAPTAAPPPSTPPANNPTPPVDNTNGPTKDKRIPCTGCGKKYVRYADMQRHAVEHDATAKKYDCWAPGCRYNGPEGFKRKDKLVQHQRNRHRMM
ncbi:hypothetical protein MMC17_004103 [Xylographa soralifera]|nr:hypothetical protein [Xylographa soralifera]